MTETKILIALVISSFATLSCSVGEPNSDSRSNGKEVVTPKAEEEKTSETTSDASWEEDNDGSEEGTGSGSSLEQSSGSGSSQTGEIDGDEPDSLKGEGSGSGENATQDESNISPACQSMIEQGEANRLTDAQQAAAPAGTYNIPSIGDCVDELTGPQIYAYYCELCHGALASSTVANFSRQEIVDAIGRSEGNLFRNYPPGSLSNRNSAIDKITATLQE